jgi:hypothetical protein
MQTVNLETIVRKSDDIFTGVIDNEMVAMSIQNGKYYQLNETGSRLLALLEEPRSVGELCREIEGGYRVDADVLSRDILEFVREMSGFGILVAE